MINNHLTIELNPREDKNEQIFYLGRLKYPGLIDCTEGVTFLVFLSEEGEEELQVASVDKENVTYSKYNKRPDRVKIALESRKDQHGKVFYICKFQFKGMIDCSKSDGAAFIVFTAKPGAEELQVVAPMVRFKSEMKVVSIESEEGEI